MEGYCWNRRIEFSEPAGMASMGKRFREFDRGFTLEIGRAFVINMKCIIERFGAA